MHLKTILCPQRLRSFFHVLAVLIGGLTQVNPSAALWALEKQDLSFGLVAGPSTGLSLQGQGWHQLLRWHAATFFNKKQFGEVCIDAQVFYPRALLPISLVSGRFYTGLGLKAVSYAAANENARFWLRTPIGTEWSYFVPNVHLFTELSAVAAVFPAGGLSWASSAGVRFQL